MVFSARSMQRSVQIAETLIGNIRPTYSRTSRIKAFYERTEKITQR